MRDVRERFKSIKQLKQEREEKVTIRKYPTKTNNWRIKAKGRLYRQNPTVQIPGAYYGNSQGLRHERAGS